MACKALIVSSDGCGAEYRLKGSPQVVFHVKRKYNETAENELLTAEHWPLTADFMIQKLFFLLVILEICLCATHGVAQEMQRLDATPQPNSQWKPLENPQETECARKVTPENVHQDYPRPTMVRERWLNLNGAWELKPERNEFHPIAAEYAPQSTRQTTDPLQVVPEEEKQKESLLDNENEEKTEIITEDAPTPELHDSLPPSQALYLGQVKPSRRTLTESYPYRILVPFPLESSLSGIQYSFDTVSYRRHFMIPDDWSDNERILLHFGAVDWEAAVIVNGQLLGLHRGGYDPFTFDISKPLRQAGKYERGVSHELIVSVYDPTQKGGPCGKQSTNPQGVQCGPVSGIWQTVWLEPVPETFIERYVATPNIDESNIALQVFTSTQNEATEQLIVVAETFHGQQSIAKVYGGTDGTILLPIPDEKLVFWTPENPFLYTLKIELQKNGQTIDSIEGYFGMRKIDLARDSQGTIRIRLNHLFRFQMGILDSGLWPDGLYTAPSDEAIRQEIQLMKDLGFTMIRKHAKVEPERWYFWCDRLGMLVWQDMPSAENQRRIDREQFERELVRMIESRYNHPCLVTWVLFHEGKGQHDTQRYVELVRRLDQSRLINAASGWRDQNVGHLVDIHQFPGPAAPSAEPFRAAVLGEFGGLAFQVHEHAWSKKMWGYQLTTSLGDFSRRYQRTMLALEQLVQQRALSAAVYRQWTDLETECGGLMTYNRKALKIPTETIKSLNENTTSLDFPIRTADE